MATPRYHSVWLPGPPSLGSSALKWSQTLALLWLCNFLSAFFRQWKLYRFSLAGHSATRGNCGVIAHCPNRSLAPAKAKSRLGVCCHDACRQDLIHFTTLQLRHLLTGLWRPSQSSAWYSVPFWSTCWTYALHIDFSGSSALGRWVTSATCTQIATLPLRKQAHTARDVVGIVSGKSVTDFPDEPGNLECLFSTYALHLQVLIKTKHRSTRWQRPFHFLGFLRY